MTSRKDHIVSEMAKLIKSNPRDEALFFEEEKNHHWFKALIPYDFFKPTTIKARVIEGESSHYPYWPQGIYIESIAKQIYERKISDENFIEIYIGVLRELFVAKDNLWAVRAIFRSVFLIPAKHLSVDDVVKTFKMIEDVANSNRFIEFDVHESYFHIITNYEDNDHDRTILREFIKHLLCSKFEDRFDIKERKLIFFKDHGFQHFSEKFFKETKNKKESLFVDIITVVTELLSEDLMNDDIDRSTTLWRPAVESNYQNQFRDSAPSIFIAILYEVSKILLDKGIVPSELQNWKTSDKNTFVRIYIALVTDYPEILDRNECANKIHSFGLRSQLRHEAYHFLNRNFDFLSTSNQASLLEAVRNLPSTANDENDPRNPLISAWEKMKWLQAIKHSKIQDAKQLFEETFKVTNFELDHPDFDSYMSSVKWGFDSPLSLEDFDQFNPSEIIQKISEFKDSKDKFGVPLAEGLYRTFENFVVKEPVKCSLLIQEILTLPATYVSSLFDGYTKCWIEKRFVPVDDLIDLAITAFNNESFLKQLVDKNSKARWAANSIFRFISAGVRDDEKAFDPKLNAKCYEVLRLAVEHVKPDEDYIGSSDALTRAINEPRGVLFESAVLLALRQARLSYDKKNNTIVNEQEFGNAWSNLFDIIKGPLESQDEQEVSLHAHLGAFYRQLMFLNKDWLYKHFDLVCPSDSQKPEIWSSFIQGFCYVTVYMKEMYCLLNSNGYLLKFLQLKIDGQSGTRISNLQENIINLAIIAFLLNDESFEEGLLKRILELNDEDQLNKVIRSLPRLVEKNENHEILLQARKLVTYLLDKFDLVQEKDKHKKSFEGIGWLLSIFSDPSDALVAKIIKGGALYSNPHLGNYEVVEYLEPFKESHTELIGTLFLELLKNSREYPTYPEEKIIGICDALKAKGKKELLATICRFYSDMLPRSNITKAICD